MWNFLTSNPQNEDTAVADKGKKIVQRPKTAGKQRRPQSSKSQLNRKKAQLQQERELQILKENQILLKKMIKIDSKPAVNTFRTPLSSSRRSSFRANEQSKIFEENQRFLRRLRSTSSHYSIAQFEEDNRYRQYLKNNISKKKHKAEEKTEKMRFGNKLINQILERREKRRVEEYKNYSIKDDYN